MEKAIALKSGGEFNRDRIDRILGEGGVSFGRLNIEELWTLINAIENSLGVRYLRMDFGIPGLPPPEVAVSAQLSALTCNSVASRYPPYAGIPELKLAVSEFVRKFLEVDTNPDCCIPTCGSTQAALVAQAIAGRRSADRRTVLFLEPGYPPMKAQARFLGLSTIGIELYSNREERLIDCVRRRAKDGIAAICWSSPNNPTWTVLTQSELAGLGEICDEEDIIAIEDATYFAMDSLSYKKNAIPSTIAHHTRNYFMLLSASKMLSYAGERIGFIITSPSLLERSYDGLQQTLGAREVKRALGKAIFNMTAGAPHSAQYAIAAILNATTRGEYNLAEVLDEYSRRAKVMRSLFLKNGFNLVYDGVQGGRDTAGFYFTVSYASFSGEELARELLYYGLSVLPLSAFDSCRTEGIRVCVALIDFRDFECLEERLARFRMERLYGSILSKLS